MNKKIICIILARGGSKGLPKKNLKILNDVPLVSRPISHALSSKFINDVVVSTDDKDIADIAIKYGAEVPFLRPKELSGDLSTTESGLKHTLLEYEKLKKVKYDIGIFLTPTDVFRNPSWIDESIMKLINNPELESVFVGYPTHKNYWEKNNKNEWVRIRDWMKIYSSRQVRQFIVREDTGLCCASRTSLWRNGRRIGDNVDIIINYDSLSFIDIHDETDLKLAQFAVNLKKK